VEAGADATGLEAEEEEPDDTTDPDPVSDPTRV